MHAWAARAALLGLLGLRQVGVEPHVHQTPAAPDITIAALWEPPPDIAGRDLFTGPAAGTPPPATNGPMTVLGQKKGGFSTGYDVRDIAGREWSVKLGDEAQTEVVASRLLWAIGYHEPPTFYVAQWSTTGGPAPGAQAPARFRPKDAAWKNEGVWSWHHNPFVGSQPYRGLIATMLLLNSTDLRTENNIVYRVGRSSGTAREWFVVRDLGATFGETGIYRPRRNDVEMYERDPFLRVTTGGEMRLGFRGLQHELLKEVNGADLHWMASLFNQLTDAQLDDAFRAAGYDGRARTRYVAAIRARLAQVEQVDDTFEGRRSDYWGARHLPAAIAAVAHAPQRLASALH